MLKITKTQTRRRHAAITLEGKLVGPWVEDVRGQFGVLVPDISSVVLDLSQLSYADQAGADLLADLIRRGARISACSSFIRELLGLETTR